MMGPQSFEFAPGLSLKRHRRNAGLTQHELTAGMISQTTLSQIEQGKRLPTLVLLRFFASKLHLSQKQLLDEWTLLFTSTRAALRLWSLVLRLERDYDRDPPLRHQGDVVLAVKCLVRSQSCFLPLFDRAIYRGYLAVLTGACEEADMAFTMAWDEGYALEPVFILDKALAVEAYGRSRVARSLHRSAAAKYWRRRALGRSRLTISPGLSDLT